MNFYRLVKKTLYFVLKKLYNYCNCLSFNCLSDLLKKLSKRYKTLLHKNFYSTTLLSFVNKRFRLNYTKYIGKHFYLSITKQKHNIYLMQTLNKKIISLSLRLK